MIRIHTVTWYCTNKALLEHKALNCPILTLHRSGVGNNLINSLTFLVRFLHGFDLILCSSTDDLNQCSFICAQPLYVCRCESWKVPIMYSEIHSIAQSTTWTLQHTQHKIYLNCIVHSSRICSSTQVDSQKKLQ